MRDLLNEIWISIRRNRLRTCLTGFAVAWGIFMLIVLLGTGNGLKSTTQVNMDGIQKNSMTVYPGFTSKPYDGLKQGRFIDFDDTDIALSESSTFSANIDEVSAMVNQNSSVTLAYGKRHLSAWLRGVYPAMKNFRKIDILAGRFIDRFDNEQQRKVVILGSGTAKLLNGGETDYNSWIGRNIKVDGYVCKVVGIFKSDNAMMGNEAYMPFTTLKVIYGKGKSVDRIEFTFHGLDTEEENEAFENKYRAVINRAHRAAPDDRGAIYMWNNFTQSLQMDKGMNIITVALWVIGLFTLLSGIVGVSNIMVITVKERTHEFGIRKAIGAKPWSITKLILSESIVITAISGYIGMVLGMLACEIMTLKLGGQSSTVMGMEIKGAASYSVGLDVALEATIVLIVAGCIAGLIPALRAARVRPVEALKAE